MNFLILSSGTRNKIIEYFKKELKGIGKVIATDCSIYAPSIYMADKYYIVPKIDDQNYIKEILKICKIEKINAIFSLIDPELSILAKNKALFDEINVTLFVSNYDVVQMCFNKFEMFEKCKKLEIPTVNTYNDLESFKIDYSKNIVEFPVFVKPFDGSCSVDTNVIYNLHDLENLMKNKKSLIIQEYMRGNEYGVDVYIDILSKKIISIFIKKKLLMRAGETDKAVSIINEKLIELITEFVNKIGFKGQIDIDVFEKNGEFYISEVNPRFGGGYPHAYECGCNFPKYMINNALGIINQPDIGNYKEKVYMMKYLDLLIKNELLED